MTETGRSKRDNTRLPKEPQVYQPLTKDKVVSDYKDRFEGQGTFKMKTYHNIESRGGTSHTPTKSNTGSPKKYAQTTQQLDLGVIEPINEPTDWVNSVALNETLNQRGEITTLRVCLDLQDLNKRVKREHYRTKTIDEVTCQLNGAKFFSIVDAKKAYWHVPVDLESSLLAPFGTHRFTRLPFLLVVSQDIFQKQLDSSLQGVVGVTGIVADNIFCGATKKEHDLNMINLPEHEREQSIVFNNDKIQLKRFYGHTWSSDGVKPDTKNG